MRFCPPGPERVLAIAVAIGLAFSASACVTFSGDQLADVTPPAPAFQPYVEHSVDPSFYFHLDGGKMVTSNFEGRQINDALLKRWQEAGLIRGSSYVRTVGSSDAGDYDLVLSGSEDGDSSIVLQVVSGLSLLVIPFYVTTTYTLTYTATERNSGRVFRATAVDRTTMVVGWPMLPLSPFMQGGRSRTFDRLANHLYAELHRQGAFHQPPPESPTSPPAKAITPSPPATPAAGTEERLRTLDALRAKGLISEEEYRERRKAIVDGL